MIPHSHKMCVCVWGGWAGGWVGGWAGACVRACACVCVCACVRACARACACERVHVWHISPFWDILFPGKHVLGTFIFSSVGEETCRTFQAWSGTVYAHNVFLLGSRETLRSEHLFCLPCSWVLTCLYHLASVRCLKTLFFCLSYWECKFKKEKKKKMHEDKVFEGAVFLSPLFRMQI